jgi:NADH:ubiquinone oxidoreductase subunit 3 (subunit A)
MLLEYIAIAVMIAVATFIAIAAIGLGELFGPKKNTESKSTPYESGMSPRRDAAYACPLLSDRCAVHSL